MPAELCPDCSAALASDQSYCIQCGQKTGRAERQVKAAAGRSVAAGSAASGPPRVAGRPVPARTAGAQNLPPWLRWVAVPMMDRRWAGTTAALALGFGLFIGVAMSPGTSGSLASGPGMVSVILENDGVLPATPGATTATGPGALPALQGPSGNEAPLPAPQTFEPEPLDTVPIDDEDTGETTQEPEPEAPEEPEEPLDPTPSKDPDPELPTVEGTVAHVNVSARSYTVAAKTGELNSVHAPKLPDPGDVISVAVRDLANGTFAEAGDREAGGSAEALRLIGTVTYRDPEASLYTLSWRGASVLVRVPEGAKPPKGAKSAVPPLGSSVLAGAELREAGSAEDAETAAGADPVEAPAPGAPADGFLPAVGAAIDEASAPEAGDVAAEAGTCVPERAYPVTPPELEAELWQISLKVTGEPFSYIEAAGIVQAVCPETREFVLSADDIRAAGVDLTFDVPKDIDTGEFEPGESVQVTGDIESDGGLTLFGLASDEGAKGADDTARGQGDLAG